MKKMVGNQVRLIPTAVIKSIQESQMKCPIVNSRIYRFWLFLGLSFWLSLLLGFFTLLGAQEYRTGLILDKEQVLSVPRQAVVFRAFGDFPARKVLTKLLPENGHQGNQGSCVGWATAYATRSALEVYATKRNGNDDELIFSPAFVYNQINRGVDQGASLVDALELLSNRGCALLRDFPYNKNDWTTKPSAMISHRAMQYKIRDYQRLGGFGPEGFNLQQIKQALVDDLPVLAGIHVDDNFINSTGLIKVYIPNIQGGEDGNPGHAISVVGYDDNVAGGSLLIYNSWGTNWGDTGDTWMTYASFQKALVSTFVAYPKVIPKSTPEPDPDPAPVPALAAGLRLMAKTNDVWQSTELLVDSDVSVRNLTLLDATQTFHAGDQVRIEIDVKAPTYTYVLNVGSSGTGHLLFPYDKDVSPLLGQEGTYLVPEKKVFKFDETSGQEGLLVIFSRNQLVEKDLLSYIENSSKSPMKMVHRVDQALQKAGLKGRLEHLGAGRRLRDLFVGEEHDTNEQELSTAIFLIRIVHE